MRENPLAHKTPHLEKFLMECCWKISYAAAPRKCLSDAILELAKGFEPLTL
jgi:hypothetical protein